MQSQEAAGRAGASSPVEVGVLLTRARRGALSARGMREVLADASLPVLGTCSESGVQAVAVSPGSRCVVPGGCQTRAP